MPPPPPASKRAAASDSGLRGRLVASQGMSPHPIDMTYGVLDAAKQTKSESVRSMGVGTDVLPCVFCFDDTGVVESYAILIENDSSRTLNIALLEAVAVMRRSWGCHAVVWAHESYTAPPSDDTRTLVERFPTDPEVEECITLLCVTIDGDAAYVVQPYKVGVGRRIEWAEPRVGVGFSTEHELADVAHRILRQTEVDRYALPHEGITALGELGFMATDNG